MRRCHSRSVGLASCLATYRQGGRDAADQVIRTTVQIFRTDLEKKMSERQRRVPFYANAKGLRALTIDDIDRL